MMVKKKPRNIAGLAAATLAAGATIIWISFGTGPKFPVPADRVVKVLDGDTIYTENGARIRLADIDAPEIGRCGSSESTKRLKQLILKKIVYVKNKGIDQYHRTQGLVYTSQGLINLKMLEEGMASYRPDHHNVPEFQNAAQKAKDAKKGIFGRCIQLENKAHPQCNIKGNINVRSGEPAKKYWTPGCGNYPLTVVELYKGDKWFCSEKEALKAGFVKPKQCL